MIRYSIQSTTANANGARNRASAVNTMAPMPSPLETKGLANPALGRLTAARIAEEPKCTSEDTPPPAISANDHFSSGEVSPRVEAVISVPVTVSALRMARQVMGMMDGESVDKIRYDMSGKLNGAGFGYVRFRSQGEFTLPGPAVGGAP